MAIDFNRRKQAEREVTKGQVEAITEAMRLIAEDDRQRGIDRAAPFTCGACGRQRSMVGSVDYGGIRLCNDCATGYELARITHSVTTCEEYAHQRRSRRN
ncbi:MAG TPA: hypothetical protein VFY79_06970 [Dehalococcoidia bacterium]|nr:hypothetical protein [Dehalococcoidia bacterium]